MFGSPALLRVALVGLLAVVVAAETLPGATPDPPSPTPIAARAMTPATAGPPAEARLQSYVSTILARPLFRADRRPPALAPGALPAAAHDGALPRLSGIVMSAAGAAAIFEGGSKPVVARVGDRVGPFTVATIAAGSVTLDGPRGTQVMRPSFDHNLVAAAPLPPPSPRLIDPSGLNLPPPSPPNIRALLEQRRAMQEQQAGRP